MKIQFLVITIAIMTIALNLEAQQTGTYTDSRDGKTYKTVKIGNQVWMAENLNYYTSDSWEYEDKSENGTKYGRSYDWLTARLVCPCGWHLPSKTEFETLLQNYGGRNSSYSALIENGNSGFNALFGGRHDYDGYRDIGSSGYFWSSTEVNVDLAWSMSIFSRFKIVELGKANKSLYIGKSVRCAQD